MTRRVLALIVILAILLSVLVLRGCINSRRTTDIFSELDTEKRQVNGLSYDAITQTLVIDRKSLRQSGRDNFGIEETDLYHRLEYEFSFKGRRLAPGYTPVNNLYINGYSVSVDKADVTITIHERSITAFQITGDRDNVYIKPVHPKERYSKILVLDPGHGGNDEGAASKRGIVEFEGEDRIAEKYYNLSLAWRIAEKLEENSDIKLYMTRMDDTYISLGERREMRDYLGDLFVSLHANASESPAVNGLWTFFYENSEPIEYRSKLFAEDMLIAVAEATDANKYEIDYGDYSVLRDSKIPAVLVEVGFLTNTNDLKKLASDEFNAKVAEGVYNGILTGFEQVGPRF